jgi:carboxymethylenebutenolidase
MKAALRAILLVVLFGAVAIALAARANPPKTQLVQFSAPDRTVTAFLAVPATGGRHPALVVIHEWRGLTSWVKAETETFAQ